MKRNRSTILAWLLAGFCTLGGVFNLVLWLLKQNGPIPLLGWVETLGWGLALPILFSVPAALIIARQPGNRVGWLMMLPALVIANPFSMLIENLTAPPTTVTLGLWLLIWLDGWSWIPVMFPIFLIPLHFPTGRPPSRRWGRVNVLAIGMWLFFVAAIAFLDTISPLSGEWTLPNPIGFLPLAVIEGPFLIVWGIGLVTMVSLSVASLFVRYRRAQAGERLQIKWLLYAGALFVVVYTLIFLLNNNEAWSTSGWVDLAFVLSILAIPAAIAVAILRYRLYDIDLLIRRTLIYTVLTAALALLYFGLVVGLQNLLDAFTNQQSPVAIVISTLAIAALFSPLRRRVQDFIDRRFYRRRYNAARVLAEFGATARDEVDVEQLTGRLVAVVQETMQPERVGLWLKR